MAENSSTAPLLENHSAFLTALLDTVDNLVVVLDGEGHILRFNRTCELSMGYGAHEVVGRCFWDIFLTDGERSAVRHEMARLLDGASDTKQTGTFENYWVAKNGSLRRIAWRNTVLRGAGVQPVVISTGTDITEQRQAQAALHESEERFRAFMDNSPMLAYIRDEKGRYVYINRGFEQAYRVSCAEFLGKSNFDIFSPAEAKEAREHDVLILETNRPDEVMRTTYSAAGIPQRWLVIKFPLQDASGARFIGGVAMDITQRTLAEEKLRESEERYALAMRGANDGLWDWNLVTDEIYFSPRWKAMLAYEEGDVGSHADDWFARIHPADVVQVRADIARHFEGASEYFENEHRLLQKDDTYRWMLARGLAIRDAGGKPYRMAGSITDMTERKIAEQQLLHDVLHDPLTGLPNRMLFLDRVQQVLSRARRRNSFRFAVLFLDLDNFKVINDTHGHDIGDQLLKAVAARLKGCLRRSDTVARAELLYGEGHGAEHDEEPGVIEQRANLPGSRPVPLVSGSLDMVARLGGDEFTILLEDVDTVEGALRVAERFQEELGEPFVLSGSTVCITLSIGVVLSSPEHDSPQDLLRQADTAMYDAKAGGKSQARLYAGNA